MERFVYDFEKAIAIITSNRPDYLRSLVREVSKNFPCYGHDLREWPLIVVDNSSSSYAEENVRALHHIKKENHLFPIFYLGQNEFERLIEREGESFREMFSAHGCPDLRNLATIACVDKKAFILLDDDMNLTESVLYEKNGIDYENLLSTGRFIHLEQFPQMSYKRPLDLVRATTSELGKKVKDVVTVNKRMGVAAGNRDKTIDSLMSDTTNGNDYYCFCHINPVEIDLNAVIKWQGLAAVTEKADCHATASIQGLSMVANGTVEDYGNLFVNYAIHDREFRVGLASGWRESSMAAFGILNTEPLPSYPLSRTEDVAYRHMISPLNPVALTSFAVDHRRSLTGRPRLSLIYYNELMGAKICKNLENAVNGSWWELSKVEELGKDQKRDILRSIKKTCAILDMIRKNGNTEMKSYSDILIKDIGTIFSYHTNDAFWTDEQFKEAVFRESEQYFERTIKTTQMIIDNWERIVENTRRNGVPLKEICR